MTKEDTRVSDAPDGVGQPAIASLRTAVLAQLETVPQKSNCNANFANRAGRIPVG